jgi:hypothetical protein
MNLAPDIPPILVPSGKRLHNIWKISMFNGYINYFDWAIFNRYVTNYQRVYPINYH